MIKRNVIGKQWFHVFDKDGVRVDVSCTEQEYKDLAKDITPILDGGAWKFSFECLKFDTPNGFIGENEYADDPENGRRIVCLQKGKSLSVDSSMVVNDELTPEGLSKYTNRFL